jgi:hypothetical protein
MTKVVTVSLCVVASLVVAPLGARAQPRGLEISPHDPPDARYSDQSRRPGPERDLYPSGPVVPHTLGFVAPLSKEMAAGRVGIAGWTAPRVPAGSRRAADPDNSGSLGFGLAAQWGGPAGRVRN